MIPLSRLIRALIGVAMIWNTPPAEAAGMAARGLGAVAGTLVLPD